MLAYPNRSTRPVLFTVPLLSLATLDFPVNMADAETKKEEPPKLSPKPSAELASDPEEDDLSDLDG